MMDEFNTTQPPQEPAKSDYTPQTSAEPAFSYTWQPPVEPDPIQPVKEKKNRFGLGIVITALCCSLLGGALGAGGVLLYQNSRPTVPPSGSHSTGPNISGVQEGNRENTIIDITQIDTSKVMTPAEVYAANVGSTVGITTSITTNFWGYTSTSAASGSGFIYSDDGYILTNYHVVEDSDSITVALYDGSEYAATLMGYDERNDIAVLKIQAEGLTPVVLGNSDNLNVGDSVVAIGNPLGELTFTLTTGVISAKDREITFSGNTTMTLFQTDCAINSGNSGGALFNLYGEVIGVTNAKYSGKSGSGASIDSIGFAIPLNSIRSLVESIIERGAVFKPYIGVTTFDVPKEYQLYGVPAGAAIQTVIKNSPAAKVGLKEGDVITAVNGQAIPSSEALTRTISAATPGDTLELTVFRQGSTKTITVVVAEQMQSGAASSR